MKNFLLLLFLATFFFSCKEEKNYNILFIAVDDLRAQLKSAGENIMVTPHMDQLAASGTQFLRHYVQVPTCGASRYSMLTGKRPSEVRHLNNNACRIFMAGEERDNNKPESFIHTLRKNGYYTSGIGKISHYVDGKLYSYSGEGDGEPEMPRSWDEMTGPIGKWGTAWNAFFGYSDGSNRNTLNKEVRPYEMAESNIDSVLPDGVIANMALDKIEELSNSDRPFFLGVGFFKPHLPFNAPKKYWDLYDREAIDISPSPLIPDGAMKRSVHGSGEMFNSYKIHPEKGGAGIKISDDYAKLLRHAYFASVSYSDAQIGKLIAKLKEKDLYDNTVIIVWGDHGWLLGDHTVWGKHSLFEQSLRSALIVRHPDIPTEGKASQAVVESIDIYPTLMEVAGIGYDSLDLKGTSLIPHLRNPEKESVKPALSFYRGGVSVRNSKYRYNEYFVDSLPKRELYKLGETHYESRNIISEKPGVAGELGAIAEKHNFYNN